MSVYFDSPIAYVFILVFLVLSTSLFLFLPPFFTFPRAEMTALFGWLVPVLCIFIPAITMRVWAEERKENTWEMLLTFPVNPVVLVLGKYLAAVAFYLLALASTWTIPVMLVSLGSPDPGPIVSGYLGGILLGSLFIALGVFISGLCKDQVIAFVMTFLVCTLVALLGWDTFATILDGSLANLELGTRLKNLVGMTGRYIPFTQGVIEIGYVLYFLLWIGLFLFLNGTYLEGRSRPHVRGIFAGIVGLCVLIGMAFAAVTSDMTLGRFDMTQDKIYTVQEATKEILRDLRVPVHVTLYISPSEKMPAEMKSLERDVLAKLREMEVASRGKLLSKVIHLEAAEIFSGRDFSFGEPEDDMEIDDKEKSIEKRLMDKGLSPFPVQALREDQSTTQLVYSALGVAYKEKQEEFIPQIVPQTLPELEYRLVNMIFKLTRDKRPVIALFAPKDELNIPPHMLQIYQQMGQMPPRQDDPYVYVEQLLTHEKYDVRRVNLDQQQGLPEAYDALVVINPRRLNSRQKWEINRALLEGKPTFMAVQNFKWNYSVHRNTISLEKRDEEPGINEILEESGISVDRNILMDSNHQPLTISSGNPFDALLGGGMTVDLPMHIAVVSESMNPDVSITSRLGTLFYLWGSRIHLKEDVIQEAGLTVKPLFHTTNKAWTVPSERDLREEDLNVPVDARSYPLAVLVEGQFKDRYPGPTKPGWPTSPPPGMPQGAPSFEQEGDPEEAAPADKAPGKLILVGCSEMFTKSFLSRSNLDFFQNCIDALTLGDKLIEVRSTKRIDRSIGRLDAGKRTFWKVMVLGLMNLVVATAGLTRAVILKQGRDKYRSQMQNKG